MNEETTRKNSVGVRVRDHSPQTVSRVQGIHRIVGLLHPREPVGDVVIDLKLCGEIRTVS